MLDKKLSDTIIKKQGDLLFTTLSEECCELSQACSKINRKKFYNKDYTNELNNFFEEICDVQINLELIKKKIMLDTGMTQTEYDQYIDNWKVVKQEKMKDVFGVATMEDYIKNLYNAGYINEVGEPKKCIFCGSSNIEDYNFLKEDYYVVEYNKRCNDCKKKIASWAYGSWQLF